MRNYILINDVPVLEPDFYQWSAWFKTADRGVARTSLIDGSVVCSIFLGMDASFAQMAPTPLLYETRVFGGDKDGVKLYSVSQATAVKLHKKLVKALNQQGVPHAPAAHPSDG